MHEGNHELSSREVLVTREKLDIPLAEQQNILDILDLPGVEIQFDLSFATYNIVQTGKLEVKFTFKCTGKTFWGSLIAPGS